MWSALKRLIRLPRYVRQLEAERDALRYEVAHWKTWMSPGHFYSPIPSVQEIRAREDVIFGPPPASLPAIELREPEQLTLLMELSRYYGEMPFPETKAAALRFSFANDAFSYADAIYLYALMRHLQPRRVIEVGSGFSSAAMLDVSERFLGGGVRFTFIDPDPSTLRSLLKENDRPEIIATPVQAVPLALFDTLGPNDFLFIDSTHVAKTGSDVNHILFEVLPRLRSGAYVHFHDVFYPFEYPPQWVYEGRAWNEDYVLRAFLEYNSVFEIALFADYLTQIHRQRLQTVMPLCLANRGGSLWLRKRA